MLLSERSQFAKGTYCMSSTIRCSGKGKTTETVKDQWFAWGLGEGEMNKRNTGFLGQ